MLLSVYNATKGCGYACVIFFWLLVLGSDLLAVMFCSVILGWQALSSLTSRADGCW